MTGVQTCALPILVVADASDVASVAEQVDFVFCAVNMDKAAIIELEEAYAKAETPVFSNNSANRWTPDVPMLMPEVNDSHLAVLETQKKRLGTKRGFIVVKPNCSIQSYTPLLTPLLDFGPREVVVSTYQAISGAGKTFADWPEMNDNVIPYIGGEDEKSEREPLRIWGTVEYTLSLHDALQIGRASCRERVYLHIEGCRQAEVLVAEG